MTVPVRSVVAPTNSPRLRGFRPDVQGLRAIAVGLVLLYHAGVPGITGGYIGVDVFFVISGFLISSHLLESLQQTGRINFGVFYARRIRRILPASWTVAILTGIAAIIIYPALTLERVLKDAVATVLYVPNLRFADEGTNYLADHSASPYQHFWSLGVEEQFYLLWPVLLLLISLIARRRRVWVIVAISAIGIASLIYGIILTPIDQPSAFFMLSTRAWELVIGAVVGALLLYGAPKLPTWGRALGGWVGVTLILVPAVAFDDTTAFPGTAAVVPTVGTALVIYFGAETVKRGPTAVLSLRPMQFLGLISYSLYLVHWPLLVLTQIAVGEQHPLSLGAKVLAGIVFAVPAAWLLFRFVETPFRAPNFLARRRPRVTLWGTLAVTIILALALTGATRWAGDREVPTGPAVSAAPAVPTVPPTATDHVPSNLTPSFDEFANDLAPMYTDGCHLDFINEEVQDCAYGNLDGDVRVAIFGDSHAAQWFPAVSVLAEQRPSVRIENYTKSSCPAVDLTVLNSGVPYSSCDRWRDAVLTQLTNEPPELVVISSFTKSNLPGIAEADSGRVWSEALSSTVAQLEDAGSEVLVLADSPRFIAAPSVCASGHTYNLDPCAGARRDVINNDFVAWELQGTETAGGTFVDLTDYICGEDSCPAVVNNLLVYRDMHHLTATFVEYLAPALAPSIEELIPQL